ncbi:MAG TPA: LysR substrate-binding domain-containing protein [Solirubrobacteraceae bacterium]|nr:LysR substrate-binding domain-containing protein [Solirubrobacteraceae bacterium]
MDLHQLRSFSAVARHRHFTRAASELHIGQPAVSQHVSRLEAELGVRLLSRTTRSVELTEAGRLLLQRADRALGELDAGLAELAELRGLVRGRLTIGAMQWLEPYDLAVALATFHERHPAIDIRVVEEVAPTMLAAVLADQLDVAFVPIEEGLPDGLDAHLLFEDELVLVVAASHHLAGRGHVRVGALREEPFVFLREGTGLRRAVEMAARSAGFEPNARFETNELSRVLALVARGLGVSAVSSAVAEAAGDDVVAVGLKPALRREVGLVWRAGRHRTPAANAFSKHVIEAAGAIP